MKIELIKKVKGDGSIYYFVEQDGKYVEGSMVYGGSTLSLTGEIRGSYETAVCLYEQIKNGVVKPGTEILLSEEI